MIIVSVIIALCLFVAILPYLISFLLKRMFGCTTVELQMRHPFSFQLIICHFSSQKWGIQHFTIQISQLSIRFSLSKMKIILYIDGMKMLVGRRSIGLNGIDLINGQQQAAILSNLSEEMIAYYLKKVYKSFKTPSYIPKQNNNKIKLIFNAFVFFLSVLFLQFFEIILNQVQASLISQIPKQLIDFSSPKKQQKTLILMQCLSQYAIRIPYASIVIKIKNSHEQQFDLQCPQIVIWNYRQAEDEYLCKIKQFHFFINLPFTFSFTESIRNIGVCLEAGEVSVVTTTSALTDVSQLIQQIIFEPFDQASQPTDQSNSAVSICINVSQAQITLCQLFEPQYDSFETFEYLSNISKAILKCSQLKFKRGEISILQTTLTKAVHQNIESIQDIILKIPDVSIAMGQKSMEIKHKEVIVNCEREQLALLGKIFSIINSRIKLDQYQKSVYQSYLPLAERHYKNGSNRVELVIQSLVVDNSRNNIEIATTKENTITYNPQMIYLNLKLNKLTHRVSLPNAKYSHEQKPTGIVHRLQFTKVIIEYKSIRQFLVNRFQLIYEQSPLAQVLSFFITDVIMIQNYDTLIEYLISFTLFKKLLQLTSSAIQEEPQSKGKKTNKNFSVDKISFNYNTETIILRNLIMDKQSTPNGYLSYLRFNLGKCEIILNQLNAPQSIKYAISPAHTLLSIASLSVNTILLQLNKQKTNIHIKSPNLNLPETNIPNRIAYYMETYRKLQIYIEAYMKNVTDDQLRQFKQKMNDLVIQPSIIIMKITDITFSADDSLYNIALLNHSRFGRQYLTRNRIYNQSEIINELNKNNKVFKLIEFNIESIKLQHHPIQTLTNSQDSVELWVTQTFNTPMQQGRLRMATAQTYKLTIKNITLKLRDYPIIPLKIDTFVAEGEILHILNIYNEKYNYWKSKVELGQIDVSMGLNLLSGVQQVIKKIKNYTDAFNETIDTEDWLQNFKKTNSNLSKSVSHFPQPYWHVLHKYSKWSLAINKHALTRVYILTQSTPYSVESINVQIGWITFHSCLSQTSLQISSLLVFHPRFQILTLTQFLVSLRTQYIEPFINIYLDMNVGKGKSLVNRLLISKQLIDYIFGLKQLRRQWLMIYGLIDNHIEANLQSELQNSNQINYFQIVNIAANKTLQRSNRELSVISVIKAIQFKFRLSELETILTNKTDIIQLAFDNIVVTTIIKPDRKEEVWRIRRLGGSLQNVVAKVGGTPNESFLRNFRLIEINLQKGYQVQQQVKYIQDIFLFAKNINFRLRSFEYQEGKAIYATRIISAKFLKAQISLELKTTINRLVKDIKISSMQLSVPSKIIPQTPLQKFRQAVKNVIRMNRKRKTKIQAVETIITIGEISLGIKTSKSLLILGSKLPTRLTLNTTFVANDKYYSDPMLQTFLKFIHLAITVQKINHVWMFQNSKQLQQILVAQQLTLKALNFKNEQSEYNYKQRINKCWCQFKTGIIEMTSQSSHYVKQIISFIIQLMDRRAMRQQVKRLDSQKYEQLKKKGNNQIKQKLQWSFVDVKKDQSLFAIFEFTLTEMNINLLSQLRQVLLKIQSSQIMFKFNLLSNTTKQFQFQISKLSVINCLEDPNSLYREVLQMNNNEQQAMKINAQIYSISAFNRQILWEFYRSIKIHINPLKIKFTEQISAELEKFFFQESLQNNHQQIEQDLDFKYSYKIPNYLRKLQVDELRVQIWYKTQSIIKRMEGISVRLDKFQVQDQFWTYKQLYYSWIKFILKELASQFFNVIGQKLFGS